LLHTDGVDYTFFFIIKEITKVKLLACQVHIKDLY